MAFKIAVIETFKRTVKVNTPKADGAGFTESTLKVIYKRVTVEKINELRDKKMKEAMLEVVTGFEDFLDADDQPIPVTEENISLLLSVPEALAAINDEFWVSLYKAKEKN
jgi:hypothetical protein